MHRRVDGSLIVPFERDAQPAARDLSLESISATRWKAGRARYSVREARRAHVGSLLTHMDEPIGINQQDNPSGRQLGDLSAGLICRAAANGP